MNSQLTLLLAIGSAIVIATAIVILIVVLRPRSTSTTTPTTPSTPTESISASGPGGSSAVKKTTDFVPSHYKTFGITQLWSDGIKGAGVKVLVIDTGANRSHQDLRHVQEISGNVNIEDQEGGGHGSHVCAIIGGKDNGVGMVGVAPECDLYIWDMGDGSLENILGGFTWARANGIDVINMSFGADPSEEDLQTEEWQAIHTAITACRNAGIFLVGAAGNDGEPLSTPPPPLYPAKFSEVMCVASCDRFSQLSYFSNWAAEDVEVLGPGEDIRSANAFYNSADNLLVKMSGTSMATPFVSGLIALFLQRQKKLTGLRPSFEQMVTLLRTHLPY